MCFKLYFLLPRGGHLKLVSSHTKLHLLLLWRNLVTERGGRTLMGFSKGTNNKSLEPFCLRSNYQFSSNGLLFFSSHSVFTAQRAHAEGLADITRGGFYQRSPAALRDTGESHRPVGSTLWILQFFEREEVFVSAAGFSAQNPCTLWVWL